MIETLVSGIIALAIAIVFLGTVLAKIQTLPLWIVTLLGIALMVAALVEGLRQERDQR